MAVSGSCGMVNSNSVELCTAWKKSGYRLSVYTVAGMTEMELEGKYSSL